MHAYTHTYMHAYIVVRILLLSSAFKLRMSCTNLQFAAEPTGFDCCAEQSIMY